VCAAFAAFLLGAVATPAELIETAADEPKRSFAARESNNDVLNGLDVELFFDSLGIGYGRLTVRVHVLEDATSLRVGLSLSDAVRVLGPSEASAAVSIGDDRSFPFYLQADRVGPFSVSALAVGDGGVRQLTGSASLHLSRTLSGTITPTGQAGLNGQRIAAMPAPSSPSRKALSPGVPISAAPPVLETAIESSSPDPPQPLTALSVTGCFSYVDADGSSVGARNVWVLVWDDDILIDDLLWNGVAGPDGCWIATGLTLEEESSSGNQDIYVQYSTWTNPAGKVIDGFLNYYSVYTPVTNDISSAFFDSGSWLPPADPNYRAAFRVHAYLEEAWQFECVVGIGQPCSTEPTVEAIVPGDGTYYSLADKRIRIEVNGDYDRSRDVVAHERGQHVLGDARHLERDKDQDEIARAGQEHHRGGGDQ